LEIRAYEPEFRTLKDLENFANAALRGCAPLAMAQAWNGAIDVLYRPMEADMFFNNL
jgi:hypothetical protein